MARQPSLRNRLLGLVATLVLALTALGAAALWQAHQATREAAAVQLLATTRALARVVDQEFARAEALLQGWALLPQVRDGGLPENFVAGVPPPGANGLPIIALSGPEGRILATTRIIPGRLGPGMPAAPEVLQMFTTGRTEISDFMPSNDPAQRRIIVAVPVRDHPGGDIRFALGLVMPPERLLGGLEEQQLPEGWSGAILDRAGRVVAETGPRLAGPAAESLPQGQDGVRPEAGSLASAGALLAFATAPLSGYRVMLAAPQASVWAALWQALGRLALPVIPIALLAGGLVMLLAREWSNALRSLTRPGLAPGVPLGTASNTLQEVAEVAEALALERRARDAAEAALREGTAWLEAAQQAADVGVFEWDVAEDSARWSAGLTLLLGLPPHVPPGAAFHRLRALVLPADRPGLDAAIAAMLQGASGDFALEFRLRRPRGGTNWLRAQVRLLPAEPLRGRRVLGAFMDISARRALEAEREALLKQQEFLAGEIHHRVKNSLQLVLSLLLLQARRAAPEAAGPLREAASRVATVAAVHRRLYEGDPAGAGHIAPYFAGLVADLRHSLAGPLAERDIRLVAAPDLPLGLSLVPERLAPLGIVATELMTNALKYGAGTVTLRIGRDGADLVLTVEDAGRGFPPGFDPAGATGLGMRVATTLTRQAGGQLLVDHAAGHGRVVLRVPMVPASASG